MASEYQKMIAGEPYRPSDPELRTLAQASRQKQAAFNREEDPLKGAEIIKTWFGSTGQNQVLKISAPDLVWLNWAKSLYQSTLGGRLWSQYPSRGKFLF